MENLNNDCEKLQKANNKLQKICDNLEDEKLYLQSELNRLSKDVELRYDKYKLCYFIQLFYLQIKLLGN